MELSEKDIEEFAALWKAEFGEELSRAEARESASALLEVYAVLARPLPESEHRPPRPTPPSP